MKKCLKCGEEISRFEFSDYHKDCAIQVLHNDLPSIIAEIELLREALEAERSITGNLLQELKECRDVYKKQRAELDEAWGQLANTEEQLLETQAHDLPNWPLIEGAEHLSVEKTIRQYRAMKAVVEAAREFNKCRQEPTGDICGWDCNKRIYCPIEKLDKALNELGGGRDVL